MTFGSAAAGYAGLQKMRAKGRLKTGEMNKLEAKFEARLKAQLLAGEIAWYKFEGIKLRLADNTFLTVDFFVMLNSGDLQAIDCKGGYMADDSNVKMKVAASIYPWPFFIARQRLVRDGGGWDITEI